MSFLAHLVHGDDREHLDGSDLNLLRSPEQPSSGLPIHNIPHGNQGPSFWLWIWVIDVILALLWI